MTNDEHVAMLLSTLQSQQAIGAKSSDGCHDRDCVCKPGEHPES